MKIDRREFITLVGATVASSSTPLFSDVGGNLDAPALLERNGWRLQVTPAGEITSFTDGKLELVNRRLGNNRPRLLVGGSRRYHCDQPSTARRSSRPESCRWLGKTMVRPGTPVIRFSGLWLWVGP